MIELEPKARAIVEAAREADLPSASDRARIKRGILVQLAAGTVVSTAAAGSLSVAAKVGIAALAIAAVAGGTAGVVSVFSRERPAAPKARAVEPGSMPKASDLRAAPRGEPVAADGVGPANGGTPVAEAVGQAPAKRGERSHRPQRSARGASNEPTRASEQARDSLRAEVALLKRAWDELRLGHSQGALRELEQYDEQFGNGALAEERRALEALATCQARPGPDARAKAQAFLSSSPRSPLAERVRAMCLAEGAGRR